MIYLPRVRLTRLSVYLAAAAGVGMAMGKGPVWGMGAFALGVVTVTALRNWRALFGGWVGWF